MMFGILALVLRKKIHTPRISTRAIAGDSRRIEITRRKTSQATKIL